MRTASAIGAVLAISVCALAADDPAPQAQPVAWDDVPAVRLWKAVSLGMVSASGSQPRSYAQVKLHVRNTGKKRVVIDLAGSHLLPRRRGSCQRLGLGPPVVADAATEREPGTVCVLLEPEEERAILMNTCCLDAHRPAPGTHRFDAAKQPLPAVRSKVLRWWAANPLTPQYAVNSAIWRNRSRVVVPTGAAAVRRALDLRLAAAHGGVYYQVKNGALTSLDTDGVRRVLGSQIEQVFPTAQAVYAVMPGDDHGPDLWRLAPTGDNPWGFVTDLDANEELLDVVPAGGGNLALLYAGHVAWFDHEQGSQNEVIELKTERFLSARVGARTGRVYVTVHDPRRNGVGRGDAAEGQSAGRFEVWVIDPRRGTAEMSERFWNVSAIRAGEAGIYGLSHKGVIRRLQRGRFKDLGTVEGYQALVAVGRDKVWVLSDDDRLIALHPTTGRPLFTSDARVAKDMWLRLDPVTGDLTYVTTTGYFIIRGEDGEKRQIPDPSAPDAAPADPDADDD